MSDSTCGVCEQRQSKYKCSLCKLRSYAPLGCLPSSVSLHCLNLADSVLSCSISCYKSHQVTHADILNPGEELNSSPLLSIQQSYQEGGNVAPEALGRPRESGSSQLETLRSSPELQLLFEKYPQLRSQLHDIYMATIESRPGHGHHSYGHHHYRKGCDRGRVRGAGRVVVHGPWTAERSLREGHRRLENARELQGVKREGIEEFSKLALRLSAVALSNHTSSSTLD